MRIKINHEWRNAPRLMAVAFVLLVAANCASSRAAFPPAPATNFVVAVQPGDTLSEIAYRYNVSEDDVVALNGIYDRDTLYVGQRIRVPAYGWADRRRSPPKSASSNISRTPTSKPAPARTAAAKPQPKPAPQVVPVKGATFLWPVDGQVISTYGKHNNGERNDGINISVARGTPIRAAEAGTVTYAGNELKGYGNLVLIRHDNGYVTAYAHADEIAVKRGARVTRGQVIGRTGATGDVAQPQLHFELRQGLKPIDPKPFLVASN